MRKIPLWAALWATFAPSLAYAGMVMEPDAPGQYQAIQNGFSVTLDVVSTYDNVLETTITLGTGENEEKFGQVESYYGGPLVRIAEMDASNETPEVVISSFTGGAHCCTSVMVLTKSASGWEMLEVGAFDARTGADPLADLNGDGVMEIRTYDDRFLYEFASYAESFAPPRYLALKEGAIEEVTRAPDFANNLREALTDLGDIPEAGATRNSWLASYAAILVMLSEDDPLDFAIGAFDEAEDWGTKSCTDPSLDEATCPKDQWIKVGYEAALKEFLVKTGYMEKAQ